MSPRLPARCLCFLLVVVGGTGRVSADDYFLTIGGGYSPTGNQISLERNVVLFQQFVDAQYPDGARHDVFFSDGDDATPDIQFEDPDLEIPRANLLLARVFRQTKYLRNGYRTHDVPNVLGATSRDNIENWFEKFAATLQAGDRLFIYVTAHGGRSTDKKSPHNTKLYLWNQQHLQMKEWVAHLDKLPEGVSVMTVMVQCYCGGFANILFNEGDSKKGFTKANRCGFFATTHSRPAAGCTPDINEENYEEYSTYFWQAIRGRTRTGSPIDRPDYDHDGQVSFAEAHAYALLQSPTVDISVKTSDEFLRVYSRTTAGKQPNRQNADSTVQPAAELLTADTAFETLVQRATTVDRVVLEGLSGELEFTQADRAKEAQGRAAELMKEKRKLDSQYKKQSGEVTAAADRIRKRLTNQWPELNNRWHPKTVEVLAKDSAELVQLIETHPDYAKLEATERGIGQVVGHETRSGSPMGQVPTADSNPGERGAGSQPSFGRVERCTGTLQHACRRGVWHIRITESPSGHEVRGRPLMPSALSIASCFILVVAASSSTMAADHNTDQPATLVERIDKVLEKVRARELNTLHHSPWVIMHAVIAYENKLDVVDVDAEKKLNAVDYLCRNAKHEGKRIFRDVDGRPALPTRGISFGLRESFQVQDHVDQFLMTFADAQVPLRTVIVAEGGKRFTVGDLLEVAKSSVKDEQELGWTLVATATYLTFGDEWTAANGKTYDIERLVKLAVQRDPRRETEGGTHHLYGVAYALNRHHVQHPTAGSETWSQAQAYVERYVRLAKEFQQDDGSFSAAVFSNSRKASSPRQMIWATGHTLEWLALALNADQLKEDWVGRGVKSLVQAMEEEPLAAFSDGGLYHAAHALRLYRARIAE